MVSFTSSTVNPYPIPKTIALNISSAVEVAFMEPFFIVPPSMKSIPVLSGALIVRLLPFRLKVTVSVNDIPPVSTSFSIMTSSPNLTADIMSATLL